MKRREFLLASAATLIALPARAAGMPHHHGMTGMDHGMGESAAPVSLAEGLPYQPLPRLMSHGTGPDFSAHLEAAPADFAFIDGKPTKGLGYNASSPGPAIHVTEGDRVSIHFMNSLPDEESTIHWHGLIIPPDADGGPMSPVPAGGMVSYDFTIPDGTAGTYWYHPHPHGKTARQVYRGLAGAFIVHPKVDPIPADYVDTDLFITDLRIDADGQMPESTPIDLMNGRIGDHLLVNGLKNPKLDLAPGSARRFRLYNATNARFLKLDFAGLPMTLIGTDGGLLEAPVPGLTELLLVPGERVELIVTFPQAGRFSLRTGTYDRGWMGPGRPDEAGISLITINVSGDPVASPPPLPEKLRSFAAQPEATVTRRLELGEKMGGMDMGGGMTMGGMGAGHMNHGGMDHGAMGDMGAMGMAFLINGLEYDMSRIDFTGVVGKAELWEIVNTTDMDHPFHIHGTQFEVIERQTALGLTKPAFRALKDTVNVARGETVRLLVRNDTAGPRMYHCHILEHEDLGMMGTIDLKTS